VPSSPVSGSDQALKESILSDYTEVESVEKRVNNMRVAQLMLNTDLNSDLIILDGPALNTSRTLISAGIERGRITVTNPDKDVGRAARRIGVGWFEGTFEEYLEQRRVVSNCSPIGGVYFDGTNTFRKSIPALTLITQNTTPGTPICVTFAARDNAMKKWGKHSPESFRNWIGAVFGAFLTVRSDRTYRRTSKSQTMYFAELVRTGAV